MVLVLRPRRAREFGRARVVEAQHLRSGGLGHESDERRPQGVEAAVVFEVVGFDVGDHDGLCRQFDERAVALVGLDHQQVAAADRGTGVEVTEITADDEGRIEAGAAGRRSAWPMWWSCRGSRPRPRCATPW